MTQVNKPRWFSVSTDELHHLEKERAERTRKLPADSGSEWNRETDITIAVAGDVNDPITVRLSRANINNDGTLVIATEFDPRLVSNEAGKLITQGAFKLGANKALLVSTYGEQEFMLVIRKEETTT